MVADSAGEEERGGVFCKAFSICISVGVIGWGYGGGMGVNGKHRRKAGGKRESCYGIVSLA